MYLLFIYNLHLSDMPLVLFVPFTRLNWHKLSKNSASEWLKNNF